MSTLMIAVDVDVLHKNPHDANCQLLCGGRAINLHYLAAASGLVICRVNLISILCS